MKRELDVAGIYPVKNHIIPFVILPMTDITGVLYVKKRIEMNFPCHEFLLDGITVHVEPVITESAFNRNLTPDKNSYLKEIYQLHCQPKLQ
jgi:molybdenum cofactor biosynthesis enzyme